MAREGPDRAHDDDDDHDDHDDTGSPPVFDGHFSIDFVAGHGTFLYMRIAAPSLHCTIPPMEVDGTGCGAARERTLRHAVRTVPRERLSLHLPPWNRRARQTSKPAAEPAVQFRFLLHGVRPAVSHRREADVPGTASFVLARSDRCALWTGAPATCSSGGRRTRGYLGALSDRRGGSSAQAKWLAREKSGLRYGARRSPWSLDVFGVGACGVGDFLVLPLFRVFFPDHTSP